MADNEAIGLLFDVSGGGSVSGASGQIILSQIQGIVKGIQSSGATKLKFEVDTSGTKRALSGITQQIQNTANQASNIGANLNKSISLNGIAQAEASFSRIDNSIKELQKNGKITDEISTQFKKAAIAKEAFDKSPTKSNLDVYKAEATAVNTLANNLKNKERIQQQAFNNAKQFKDILAQSRKEYDKYSDNIKKHSDINERWKAFNESLAKGTYSGSKIQARDELAQLDKELYETGDKVETFRQKLANLFNQHLSTAVALVGVHLIQQGIHGIYENVVELDKALVNIQIATGYTRDQTKGLMSSYSQYAKELGVTTAQTAEAADNWLRQGKSISETNTLIKDSIMLSKLGEISSDEATTALTSTTKAYNIASENAISVVDKLTKVDMESAASAGGLAKSLQEVATSAQLGGISLDKLIGYTATVKEVTQDGDESIGIFEKALFSRMGAVRDSKLIDPETQDDISNVERVLSGFGIALRDEQGHFKNFGDILDTVAKKWDSFSNTEQRAIGSAFAGQRQSEKFYVLMTHYGDALKYAEMSANSAGTATSKFNNSYLQGIEASQNKAKASFEALSTTIANSEIVKGAFAAGSGILGFLNKLLSAGDGAVPKIALLVAGLALLNKAIKAISTASVGRAKKIALMNMPTNDLMVTWNELVA